LTEYKKEMQDMMMTTWLDNYLFVFFICRRDYSRVSWFVRCEMV